MARIESLKILLDPTGQAYLQELYGRVIENVEKGTISGLLKNRDLSGEPTSGTVEATRYQNSASKNYGTARTATKGDQLKIKPVTIAINTDKEIIEELEDKDVKLYGVDGVLDRRSRNHISTFVKDLERAFFFEAANSADVEYQPSDGAATIAVNIEEMIVGLEKTKNAYVEGVERNLMSLVLDTETYSLIRNYLDFGVSNANINTAAESFGYFHGVICYSSIYLPAGVNGVLLVDGSVAQPVLSKQYKAEKIPLSNAWAIELFYSFGTKTIASDLICAWKTRLATPTATLQTADFVIAATPNASSYEVYSDNVLIATVNPATVGAGKTVALGALVTGVGTYAITAKAVNTEDAYQTSLPSTAVEFTVSG